MYSKDYYLAHKEKILARAKKWREEHPEEYKKILKRCVKRNGLKYKIQQKLYRYANWDKIEQQQKNYYEENRSKVIDRVKRYRQQNEEKLRQYHRKYKLKKRYENISGWVVSYENQNERFHWVAVKKNYKITDDKENGFPSLHSAYKNAVKYLGDPVSRG